MKHMDKIKKKFGPELDTKSGLKSLYAKHSCKEICKMFNINEQLLYRRLKMFGITTKSKEPKKLSKNLLLDLYHNKKKSRTEIASHCNVSKSTIDRLFTQYAIKGRSFTEAGQLRSHKIKKQMLTQWKNQEYREKMVSGFSSVKEKMTYLANSQLGQPSSIQKILYSILDDLNIKYESEKIIGYWSYDCFLPLHNILIECQGDYWHSLNKTKPKDAAKATYIESYFPHIKLKHIWEHEFMCKNRIIDLIKYWTGIELNQTNFSFDSIVIKEISDHDAKTFIAKYHYYGRIGKNSIRFGAYINNILIAICTFASVTRKESATRLELNTKQIRELTRFCIHPQYQKKNFASWFISKCIKLIKNKIPMLQALIAFSDTTYNHSGTIYKAGNWILDGEVKPSYWYEKNGYVMHKKTLWDHASKMGLNEVDYASQKGYKIINGQKKLRFIKYI